MIVTHRTPIVLSFKIDGSANGQLTSSKLSQFARQQATGEKQIPNVLGHNFNFNMQGLNITALVHPKIIHSNYHFMFSVEQANNEAFGVQTEKSHQLSMPMEVSVAYSNAKQLVSLAIEPKTPVRMSWTKEAAKTFINQLTLNEPAQQLDNWLGQEHLIRVPSRQSQYKRQQRSELFVPSILSGVQSFLNEPKEKQMDRIQELETPYKFERRQVQPILDLEFYLEGATDDEDVAREMGKPELSQRERTNGQLQWSSTEELDELDQHSKSGPFSQYLHILESAMNRPSKYLEFYSTLKPEQQQTKSPVYRFDFVLNTKQSPVSSYQQQQQSLIGRRNPMPINRLDVQQSSKLWESIEQTKKLNKLQQQQIMLQEAY